MENKSKKLIEERFFTAHIEVHMALQNTKQYVFLVILLIVA